MFMKIRPPEFIFIIRLRRQKVKTIGLIFPKTEKSKAKAKPKPEEKSKPKE